MNFEKLYRQSNPKDAKLAAIREANNEVKERLQEYENKNFLKELRNGRWFPHCRFSEAYLGLIPFTNKKDWPTLRETIIRLEKIEEKIFNPTFKRKNFRSKIILLEQYYKTGTFERMNTIRESFNNDNLIKRRLQLNEQAKIIKENFEELNEAFFLPALGLGAGALWAGNKIRNWWQNRRNRNQPQNQQSPADAAFNPQGNATPQEEAAAAAGAPPDQAQAAAVAAQTSTGNQVENTMAAQAAAQPGDYMIRSDGTRVVLNQGDITWAQQRIQQGASSGGGSSGGSSQQVQQQITRLEARAEEARESDSPRAEAEVEKIENEIEELQDEAEEGGEASPGEAAAISEMPPEQVAAEDPQAPEPQVAPPAGAEQQGHAYQIPAGPYAGTTVYIPYRQPLSNTGTPAFKDATMQEQIGHIMKTGNQITFSPTQGAMADLHGQQAMSQATQQAEAQRDQAMLDAFKQSPNYTQLVRMFGDEQAALQQWLQTPEGQQVAQQAEAQAEQSVAAAQQTVQRDTNNFNAAQAITTQQVNIGGVNVPVTPIPGASGQQGTFGQDSGVIGQTPSGIPFFMVPEQHNIPPEPAGIQDLQRAKQNGMVNDEMLRRWTAQGSQAVQSIIIKTIQNGQNFRQEQMTDPQIRNFINQLHPQARITSDRQLRNWTGLTDQEFASKLGSRY